MTLADEFPRRLHATPAFHLARATWSPSAFEQLRVVLPPSPEAPARVRRCARGFLVDELPAKVLDDVLLLVSELVTNAVRHPVPMPSEEIRVHIGIAPDRLRVEVCDSGPGFDIDGITPPMGDRPGGRGLRIVDAIATRWGRAVEERHCIWFEIGAST